MSPEAKQAAIEVEELFDNSTYAILSMPKDRQTYEHYRAEVERFYDTATAKLREELEYWKANYASVVDKLAHQQPSARMSNAEWEGFLSTDQPSATTPDVEKIALHEGNEAATWYWQRARRQPVGITVEHACIRAARNAAAQAREPLVKLLRQVHREINLFGNKGVIQETAKAIRELLWPR